MQFALLTLVEAVLENVQILSHRNKKADERSGAKLSLSYTVSNELLAAFDDHLKPFLFTAQTPAVVVPTKGKGKKGSKDNQTELEGTELSDMPYVSAIGEHLGSTKWQQDMAGYTLTVDHGMGGRRSNLVLQDCDLSKWRLKALQGGMTEVKHELLTPHVTAAAWDMLANLKRRKIKILLTPPAIVQQDLATGDPKELLDATGNNPFGRTGGIPPTATDAFLAAHPQ